MKRRTMRWPPAPTRAARGLAPLLLIATWLTAGCDGGTEPAAGAVTGTWVAEADEGRGFLVIGEDSLVFYAIEAEADCVSRFDFGLEPIEGARFRLDPAFTAGTFEATLMAEGDDLAWPDSPFPRSYTRTDADPTGGRPPCLGGGADDVDCDTLPELVVTEPETGELDAEDPAVRGFHYDLYRISTGLDPDETGDYTISVTSDDFDTYLYLYGPGGALQARNDDATPATTNSALTAYLDPACRVVEVTSFSAGETGTYTLRAE